MSKIDQFESVFKAADKPRFDLQDLWVRHLLIVRDLAPDDAEIFDRQAEMLIRPMRDEHEIRIQRIEGSDFRDATELIALVNEAAPDLMFTHRGLRSDAGDLPYSIGTCIEALTQATAIPVGLLPDPDRDHDGIAPARTIIAITDHLAGDHRLVSFAAHMTADDGRLILAHVEDEVALERFLAAIAKIPDIDTDTARTTIVEQLLKEPHDYITSSREVVQQRGLRLTIDEVVTVGHRLRDYKQLVDEHHVDLVVMNTKDEDQLAMHGLAYPLTVELTSTPLLLL